MKAPGTSYRYPTKLISRITSLSSGIAKSDFPPTTQAVEVHEILKKRLTTYQSQLNKLLNKDLPAFNNLLKEKNIQNVIVVKTP
jgi:hypothetical protein